MTTTQRGTRTQRGSAMATVREFNSFADQVFTRLDEMSNQLKAMLPREIYELQQRQIATDAQEVSQRVAAAEKAIAELSSQLSTTRLATVNDTRTVEHQVASSRYEAQQRLYDLLKSILFIAGGAVMSYLAMHLH